ncbi:hypothetical protein [Actinomadura litoris]|uniref:hypothetical protein n=1 Tax=Actinomadura litoris TaxID=2678616 RepID=UPI001FA7382C|nr:hypothetical protein [Actinomadura litoris]
MERDRINRLVNDLFRSRDVLDTPLARARRFALSRRSAIASANRRALDCATAAA